MDKKSAVIHYYSKYRNQGGRILFSAQGEFTSLIAPLAKLKAVQGNLVINELTLAKTMPAR